jgi:ankyrin repeat protein
MRIFRQKIFVSAILLSGATACGACAVDPSLYHAYDIGTRVKATKAAVKKGPHGNASQRGATAPFVPQRVVDPDPERQHYWDLVHAVQRHDLHTFVRLLPADPRKRHDELASRDLLEIAAAESALDIVRQIISWYPDLAHPRKPGWSVTRQLEQLIRTWSHEATRARDQDEPLAGPPVADRIEALRYLLEWGADPDGTPTGSPLVMIAGMPASDETGRAADMLVRAGARNRPWNDTTPLRTAAASSSGRVMEALLRLPLSRGELDDALVRTPVRSANPVLGLLVAHGADVNTSLPGVGTGGPYPAVFLAVQAFQAEGDLSVVKQVLAYGADPKRASYAGTPLMVAAHDPAVLRLLLAAGADPEVRDAHGLNALMMTRDGDDESIRMLLDRGSTVRVESVVWREDAKPRVPIGPVSWSLIHGNDSLAAALVTRQAPGDADCGAAYYAAQAGANATLRALLQRRVSLTGVRDDEWLTPFMIAAREGELQTVRFFLDQGIARPDESIPRRPAIVGSGGHPSIPVLSIIGGESALDIAQQARQGAVVEELKKRGAH